MLTFGYRGVHTSYTVIAVAYTSASLEGVRSLNPNSPGTRSSGAMKEGVPSPALGIDDSIPKLGSCTIVIDPKSARHAVTGSVFVIRILA